MGSVTLFESVLMFLSLVATETSVFVTAGIEHCSDEIFEGFRQDVTPITDFRVDM